MVHAVRTLNAAGALIGYGITEAPEPVPADTPPMFRPLQELENLAPGTWYVNVLAVLPAFRNRGLHAAHLPESRILPLLADDPSLIRTPLVRFGNEVTVGLAEEEWKGWEF